MNALIMEGKLILFEFRILIVRLLERDRYTDTFH